MVSESWPDDISVRVPAALEPGVAANHVEVEYSAFGFTLDFVQVNTRLSTAVLVARVQTSPLSFANLMDSIVDTWSRYAAEAMPPDHGDDDEG